MVYVYNGILLGNKNEQIIDAKNVFDKIQHTFMKNTQQTSNLRKLPQQPHNKDHM